MVDQMTWLKPNSPRSSAPPAAQGRNGARPPAAARSTGEPSTAQVAAEAAAHQAETPTRHPVPGLPVWDPEPMTEEARPDSNGTGDTAVHQPEQDAVRAEEPVLQDKPVPSDEAVVPGGPVLPGMAPSGMVPSGQPSPADRAGSEAGGQ